MDSDGSARVIPTARLAGKIQSAAIGNQAGFDGRVRRTERDGVIMESCVHVSKRWQEFLEKFVTGAIGLSHRSEAPHILLRSHRFFEGWQCVGSTLTSAAAESSEQKDECQRGRPSQIHAAPDGAWSSSGDGYYRDSAPNGAFPADIPSENTEQPFNHPHPSGVQTQRPLASEAA